MGRRADEQLPEVVQNRSPAPGTYSDHLPEVVPDTSPEAAQQKHYLETDKYPAYYDNAPKFPLNEEPPPGLPSPGQHYHQSWGMGGEVSALSPNSSVPWQSFPHDDQATFVGSEPEPEKRTCGLRRRTFIIVTAVILGIIIVAAAVGGGVGGALAQKSTEASSSTSDSTGGTSTTGTSSASPTPTFLNNQTDENYFKFFKFQAFSEPDFQGNKSDIYEEKGFYDLPFNLRSWVWVTNKTDCCVTFCKDKSDMKDSFWCDSDKRTATKDLTGFPRVSLWCGNRLNEESQRRCS